jgi:glycine cleavage system H protein
MIGGTNTVTKLKKAPKGYKYTREHEWICCEGKVGVSDYAQFHLGDVVFLDLPAPGTQVVKFSKMGEIESVKAVSDLFAPASGRVLEINQNAIDQPSLINQDPYGNGWLLVLEISNPGEINDLMDSDDYDKLVATLSENT